MKILIVEDNQDRINQFEKILAGQELTIVKTAAEGKELVMKHKYDLIMLDHDLGDRVFVNSEDENTGYQVAKAICESQNKSTHIVVHSWNPEGVKNIMSLQLQTFYHPFGTAIFQECINRINNPKTEP